MAVPVVGDLVHCIGHLAFCQSFGKLPGDKYCVQRIYGRQRIVRDYLCAGQSARAGQLGLVSFQCHYRPVDRYCPVGFSGVEHGRAGVCFGLLAVVPGLFGHRSCHRFAALWRPQLGMVARAGDPGGDLCHRDPHGAGSRSGNCCGDGRVRFAGRRDFPDPGCFRAQKIAQAPVNFSCTFPFAGEGRTIKRVGQSPTRLMVFYLCRKSFEQKRFVSLVQ